MNRIFQSKVVQIVKFPFLLIAVLVAIGILYLSGDLEDAPRGDYD